MATPPPIATDRLDLVPFDTGRHLTDAYVSWLGDAEVVRYSEQRHRDHSLESCRVFVAGFDGTPSLLWAIETRSDGRHIGNIHADIDPANATADVAILIGDRAAWGQGLGQEAWDAVLDHLLSVDGADLRKVTAGCMADNAAMRRLMERSGMRPDGTKRAQFMLDGRAVDAVYAARFADDG